MGYISIQINKAKGSADTGASDHIERKTTPKNETLHAPISTVSWCNSPTVWQTAPRR
jgi:hypothetical protein